MGKSIALVWVVAMVETIVATDLLFFRHLFWARLLANLGLVLLFGAFYLRFVGRA